MSGQPSDRLGDTRLGIWTGAAHQLEQQLKRAGKAVEAAALEGEFARHLPPAVACAADEAVRRHEYPIEHDLIEIVVAGEIDDRPDRDPWCGEVEDQLAQAAMAVGFCRRSAHESDREMRFVRIARPYLG